MSSHPQSTLRVFVSDNVLLPGADNPTPATIEVDLYDGRIKQIVASRRSRTDYADVKDVDWVDVGALWILPGLVEYVYTFFFFLKKKETIPTLFPTLVHTST